MPDQLRVAGDGWNAHWTHYAGSASQNPAQQIRHGIIARLLSEDPGKGPTRLLDLGSGQRAGETAASDFSRGGYFRTAGGSERSCGLGRARDIMKVFRALFHANLVDCRFGWQMVATARKLSV